MILPILLPILLQHQDPGMSISTVLHHKHWAVAEEGSIKEFEAGFLRLAPLPTPQLRKLIVAYLFEIPAPRLKDGTSDTTDNKYSDWQVEVTNRQVDVGVINRIAFVNASKILGDKWFGVGPFLHNSGPWVKKKSRFVLQRPALPMVFLGCGFDGLGEFDYLTKHAKRRVNYGLVPKPAKRK